MPATPAATHASFAVRVFRMLMVVMVLSGYLPTAAAASRPTPSTPAATTASVPISVAQAEANFHQALNQLINTPASSPPELLTFVQKQLEEAAAQYQLAQAQAATSNAPAATSAANDSYVYSANAETKRGDSASWLMLGNPKGDRQAFDQAFGGITATTHANSPVATTLDALVGPVAASANPSPMARPGGVRECGEVKVMVDDIQVTDNAEAGDAEWRFFMVVDGDRKDWNRDGVQDTTYGINYSWNVMLDSDAKSFRFETGGYEDDASDDPLSTLDITYNSGNQWGVGNHSDEANNNTGKYRLNYRIECVGPRYADLRTSASVNKSSLPAGDNIEYTFTAYNDGPVTADGVEMTIVLPSGLSNPSLNQSGGAGCSPSGTNYVCNLLSIPSGGQVTVNVQADTPDNHVGPITATSSVRHTGSQFDIYTSDNNASATTTLLPKANTGVALGAPTLVERNHTGTTSYQVTATVTNGGPTYAPAVQLTPTLPVGVSLANAAPTTGTCNGSGVCELGDIAVGATVSVVYTLNVGPTVLERTALPFSAAVAMNYAGAVEITPADNTATQNTRLTYWDMQLGATSPGGDVQAVAYVGGDVFVGGAFGVKRWNGTTWNSVGSGGPDGTVFALLDDGQGGVYAGGNFTNIGPRLAHWNGSGWNSVGSGVPNGTVFALARDSDNDLYVGGQFSQIGALTTNNIGRWDGSAWHALGVAGVTQAYPNTQPQVRAILADGGFVYVGGLFKTPAPNIARWNKTQDAWESLGTGIAYPGGTSVVHALALLDGRVYVGGRFSSAGGQPSSRIAAWDPAAQQWLRLGTGLGGAGSLAANSLIVTGGELMVGGTFTTVGGIPSRHIARWNGAAWSPVGSGADSGAVNALAVGETPLTTFVGGTFPTVDGSVVSGNIGQYRHEQANLALSQTMMPNPPLAGQPLSIVLAVTNSSAAPVQGVSLRNELPVDAAFISATGSQGACVNDAGIITCSIGTLAAGATATITIQTNVAAVLNGPFINRVWAGATQLDQNPADNRLLTTSDVNAQADLTTTLTAPASATAGESITYTFEARNNGPSVATSAVATFTLPNGGATLQTATGLPCEVVDAYADLVTLRCVIGNMVSGEAKSATLTFDVRPDTRGALDAVVALTSNIPDPDGANNTQTAATTVQAVADIEATLTAPARVYQPPQEVGVYSYGMEIRNAGPSLARDAVATLDLPAETTFVSASPNCVLANGTVTCRAGDLAVDESAAFAVVVYVNVGTANAAALAAALATQVDATDPQASNNAANATTIVTTDPADATVDLLLALEGPATIDAGDTAIYTVRVSNSGAIASGATITDTLPTGATFDPSNSDPDCYEVTQPQGSVACQIEELAVGEARELIIAAFIPASAEEGATLTNSAVVASVQTEAQPADNAATASTTVTTSADLALTQETSHTNIAAGETVTFTLTLENNGPSQARDITLSNPQPDGAVLDSAEATQGTCDITNDEVTCELGDLDANGTITVDVAMFAGSGTITNTATVAASTVDPDETNNEASAETEVAAAERETREFGAVEITADVFIDLPEGGVQAFGDVWLGEHLHLSGDTDSVVIDDETITGEGTLTYLQEGVSLFTGDFEGTLTDDAATITPADDVEYLLTEFSRFDMNEFEVSDVDLIEGRTNGATTELEIKAEGFEETLNASLFIEPGLVLGGTVEAFSFVVGEIEFEVEGAGLTNEGLIASSVKMTLPDEWGGIESTVEDLSITLEGVTIGGAEATVPLPDFELSGDEVQVSDASVTIVYNGDGLMLTGQGTIEITLPDNEQTNQIEFSISPDGEFSAAIDTLSLAIAGSSLELNEIAVDNAGLSVAEGVLTLPESLNESTLTVEDVSISADGLEIGGAEVALNLPDLDIGNGEKVRFSEIVATLRIEDGSYTFGIKATLELRLPQNSQDVKIQAKINNQGAFSGSLNRITLKLATVSLVLDTVSFNNNGLAVSQATLQLPPTLGGSSAALINVRIDDSGLRIGGGSVRIAFPDIRIGSASGFAMKQVSAELRVAADRTYKVTLYGTVEVKVKTLNAMVKGSISVDSQDRLSGEIESFNFGLAGLEVQVLNAHVNNGELSVAEASLKTPSSWGGATVAVYNLRISSAGVKIGGGKFAVPEIKAGKISLGSLYGELREEGNGYSISLGGKFRTPALGGPNCALNVGASIFVGTDGATNVKLTAFEAKPNAITSFELRQVKVGLTGCKIPIAQTGFYLTRVEGSLTLTKNQTIIDLGVTVANDGEWLKGDADMRMQFNPWQIDFAGSVTLFSIFKAAEMKAQMRSGYFSADLRVRSLIFEGSASLTAWTTDGSFHLVGRATLEVGFKKGSVWEGCVPVVGPCVSIPPFELKIGEVGTEFGEFNGGVWGLKGWAQVLSFRAGFYIDSGGTFSVRNIDQYRLVTPPSVQQARSLAQSVQLNRALSPAEQTLLNDYTFNANDVIIDQNISVATDVMFVMSRRGASPTLTLIDPTGQRIEPNNLPRGIQLVEAPVDGATQTLYVVPQAMVGTWKAVLTGDGNDYIFQVLGANPAPELKNLAAINTSANTARADWALASGEITTTLDIFLNPGPIAVTHTITGENGLPKDITTPMYGGFPVAKSVTTPLDGAAAQTTLNLDDVESGTYYVWFNADDARNPPVRAYAPTPIIVSHEWTSTWAADTIVQHHERGFDVSWNDHPNPDVDVYNIEVGTQPGLIENTIEVGDQLAQSVDNLSPGQLYYITLVGVDEETGRTTRSETITAIATGPTFDLSTTNDVDVTAGGNVEALLSLSTPSDVYPDQVQVQANELPDGVNISLDAPEGMATPTKAGTPVRVTITTTPSMVGGIYEVPITASGYGAQDTAIVRLTVREPRIEVQATTNAVSLLQNGESATVALAASSQYGATGTVALDLLDAPPGLVYGFSANTLAPNGTVSLILTDTGRLENGTYNLRLRAERGFQQQILPLTLTVRKPVFGLASQLTRLGIQKGETATFAIAVDGENLSGPVTLRLASDSSPIGESETGFAATAARSPKPSLAVAADGTGYLIVRTSQQTPAGSYRLVIEGQHGGVIKRTTVNLRVVNEATSADLGVSQTTSARTAVVGDLFTYTVRVANYGPLAANNVVLQDTAPVGTTVVSAKPSRGTCQVQAGQVTCDLYALRRGAFADVAIVVRVNATLEPGIQLINSAEASSAVVEGYTPDNISVKTTGTVVQSDVAVSIAAQTDQAVAGNTMTYSVVAWNNGASTAKGVQVATTLPSGIELVSATPSQGTCGSSLDGQVVVCEIGQLGATAADYNATVRLETRVKPSARATLLVESTVDSATTDRADANNTAQARVRIAQDVALSVAHVAVAPEQVIAGDDVTYQLRVANKGASDAPDVVVIDMLPAEMVNVSQVQASQGFCYVESRQVTCRLGTLGAGATATIILRGRIDGAARNTLRNTAQASSSVGEVITTDNSTINEAPVVARADLSLSITSITPESFQFIIDNNGSSDANQVMFTTTLPDEMSVVDVLPTRGTCAISGKTITCSIGAMRAKDRVVVSVRTSVQPGVFTVAVQGQVKGSEHDPREANNSAVKSSSFTAHKLFLPIINRN